MNLSEYVPGPGFISGSRAVPKRFRMIHFYCAYVDAHQGPFDYDEDHMTALHHACQHSSCSWRVAQAAIQLIECTRSEDINAYTTGHALYYTPLMYVCDAADNSGKECE